MSERNQILLLEDILESANKIANYIDGYSYEQFINDSKTVDAVIRNFEVIGEAATRLSDEFKSDYTDVDWQRIRGFRNRIVHEYFGIDYSIVWDIIKEFLPVLTNKMNKIKKTL